MKQTHIFKHNTLSCVIQVWSEIPQGTNDAENDATAEAIIADVVKKPDDWYQDDVEFST